tara:strand:+ start:1081 stop:2451 length:1371 start_codon:yes stop_codon:yes gene_type:complete
MPKEDILNIKGQPQSIEAEQAVLGSMLLAKEAVSKALQWLKPEMFYKDAHIRIASCMIGLFEKGEPIDAISVVDRLKKKNELKGVGGSDYIIGLAGSVPTTANIEHYAKIVLEKSILRTLINVSHDVSKNASDDNQDVDDILDHAESAIFNISEKRLKGGFDHLGKMLHKTFEKLDEIAATPGTVTGVASGLTDLDNITSGFHSGELIIIAGRPGMGKTALALSMGRNAAVMDKVGIGMFSLEMANHQLAMRLLCAEGRVDSHLVRTGKLPKSQWKNLSHAVGHLAEAPIYLDDTAGMSVLEVRAKARRLKAEHNIGMIIVDYLQLMSGPKGVESRQQEISHISRSLKNLAKEIDVPVVALSQLSRAVENRTDRRPQLSDLRESGAIEQDADVVMFLYRPWIYSQEDEDKGKAQVIVAKQRNGPTGNINVTFIDRFARFENSATISQSEAESAFNG